MEPKITECSNCHGDGFYSVDYFNAAAGEHYTRDYECKFCNGTGQEVDPVYTCYHCGARRYSTELTIHDGRAYCANRCEP